jgi:hypothetical protein
LLLDAACVDEEEDSCVARHESSTYAECMDERIRAEHTARRGLTLAILVPTVLFGSMLVAWEIYVAFFMNLSGLG